MFSRRADLTKNRKHVFSSLIFYFSSGFSWAMALCRYYQLSIPCHRSILHFELQQKRQLGLYRRYENFLEKRYPKVYRMHRLIVDGKYHKHGFNLIFF